MAETVKKTGKGNPPIEAKFKKGHKIQPRPEQKSEGRERRKHAQKMMDLVRKYQDMTRDQLQELSKNKDVTLLELQMIRYVADGMKNDKLLTHMIDKHVSNAPTQISGEDGGPIQISSQLTEEQKRKMAEIYLKK